MADDLAVDLATQELRQMLQDYGVGDYHDEVTHWDACSVTALHLQILLHAQLTAYSTRNP